MLHSVKKVTKSDFYSMIAEKAGSCTGCSVFNLSALSLSRLALREVFSITSCFLSALIISLLERFIDRSSASNRCSNSRTVMYSF